MKIESKRYFEVNYSFMKPVSQKFWLNVGMSSTQIGSKFNPTPFSEDMQIWAFFDPILTRIKLELKISKFVKAVIRSQYIRFKVSKDSYFDPYRLEITPYLDTFHLVFIIISTWCTS